jgi:hypothetical protein
MLLAGAGQWIAQNIFTQSPHAADAVCGDEIVGILKPGIGPTAFPIYRCGAGDGQAVGPLPITSVPCSI